MGLEADSELSGAGCAFLAAAGGAFEGGGCREALRDAEASRD